jgi:hypothetical protein
MAGGAPFVRLVVVCEIETPFDRLMVSSSPDVSDVVWRRCVLLESACKQMLLRA